MAYDVEIIEYAKMASVPGGFPSGVPEGPPLAFTNMVAVGKTTLNAFTRFVVVRNRSGSTNINVKLQAVTGHVNASASNSPTLAVSTERTFALPKTSLAGGAEIDIR